MGQMVDLYSPVFWRRYMLETFLQYWQRHCPDREHGGYVADFDRQWHLGGPGNKSLVSQGRLVYTFSAGLRHSGEPAFADLAAHGVAFLRRHMADAELGGWLWRCRRDGSPLEPVKHTYGHAFAIFGLSEYARATADREAARLAEETLRTLYDKAAGPVAGLWTLMDRAWQPIDRQRGQNPHMHLLEACMSLYDVTGAAMAMDTAVQIAELATTRLVHPQHGCLEEFFGEDWSALPEEVAAPIQVGHQFEWCWLLNRLADRTGQERWRGIGGALMDWGLRHGTDREHGGFYNTCDRRGQPIDTNKSHWVTSEGLRALLYLVAARKREDLRSVFERAVSFALEHYGDAEYGGWYTSVHADGSPHIANKGSEWKLDYHMTSLCDEAIRLLA